MMTKTEYTDALKRIDELRGAPPGSPDGDALDILIEKVSEYERVNYSEIVENDRAYGTQERPCCPQCGTNIYDLVKTWGSGRE